MGVPGSAFCDTDLLSKSVFMFIIKGDYEEASEICEIFLCLPNHSVFLSDVFLVLFPRISVFSDVADTHRYLNTE